MSLPVPKLNDRDFDQLVDEARELIPRYAPAWTDHNIHDPGITLLELIAWLVDQQIYQVDFVSDRHIQAFAALLGVEPRPAEPATGLVWPDAETIDAQPTARGTDLFAGTEMLCVGKRDLSFVLDCDVHITPARLAGPTPRPAGREIHFTAGSASRHSTTIHQALDGSLGVIEIAFDRPLVAAPTDLPIAIGFELDAGESATAAEVPWRGTLEADYRLDVAGAVWRTVPVVADHTHALNRTGVVLLRIPPFSADAAQSPPGSRLRFRTLGRVSPLRPAIRRIVPNVLPVEQRTGHPSAMLLQLSQGRPGETIEIRLTGIIDRDPLRALDVHSGPGSSVWVQVEDLAQSGPQDPHFQVDWERGLLVFGNGVNGRVLPAGAQVQHREFRVSAGEAGNLAAGQWWRVRGAPMAAARSDYGRNQEPLRGGRSATSLDELRELARVRALRRATLPTNAALKRRAETLPGFGVERAEVITGFHPGRPRRTTPGVRTMIVLPQRSPDVDPLSATDAYYAAALDRVLATERILGERLSVVCARRVPVSVSAELRLEEGCDTGVVIPAAAARLNARLTDVPDPGHRDLEPWPAGRAVTPEEIMGLLATVEGVAAVQSCRLARGGEPYTDQPVELSRDEIAIGKNHQLRNIRA